MKLYQTITRKSVLLLLVLFLTGSVAYGGHILKSPSERERTAKGTPPGFSTDPRFSITRGTDNQGCYYDIVFTPVWTYTGTSGSGLCDVNILPHGFIVEFAGTTISSLSYTGSPWYSGAPTQVPSTVAGSNYVYWSKVPIGACWSTGVNSNAIPSNETQQVRIRVNANTAPVVTVSVRELTGNAWPYTWAPPSSAGWYALPFSRYWDIGKDTSFSDQCNYSIGADTSFCKGTATTFNLQPSAAANTVKWYKYTVLNANDPCPSTVPFSSLWQLDQTGGISYNTNAINNTTCYVAVIDGCNRCFSNVRRVTVCPGAPSASLTTTTAAGSSPLQTVNSTQRACLNWSGTFTIPAANTFPCPTTIVGWERSVNGGTWQSVAGAVNSLSTGMLSVIAPDCATKYEYRAVLTNACGTSNLSAVIYIDNKADGGTLQTLTGQVFDIGTGSRSAPDICYGTGTRLLLNTTCGKIQYWEYRDELASCSGTYPATWTNAGAGVTNTWWTGLLYKARQYRAYLENGACTGAAPSGNGVYSPVITVKVKPQLTVNIATTSNLLCANPVLTAITSYGTAPCNYAGLLTYQWYRNGGQIAGATQATFTPSLPGNYTVVVKGQCGEAKSKMITICNPVLKVTGPCCICKAPDKVALSASIVYDKVACGPAPAYQWSTGATTPGISVTAPGVYTVKVIFGTGPAACILQKSITVTACR